MLWIIYKETVTRATNGMNLIEQKVKDECE